MGGMATTKIGLLWGLTVHARLVAFARHLPGHVLWRRGALEGPELFYTVKYGVHIHFDIAIGIRIYFGVSTMLKLKLTFREFKNV